jgi:hypothetical protein
MSLKIPVTQPGIDPGTVRQVAQRLNHYATPGPMLCIYILYKYRYIIAHHQEVECIYVSRLTVNLEV